MSRRSRKHKKRFACGHRGFGQYCHCCADRRRLREAKQQQRSCQRQQWKATFAHDPIDLRRLPKAIVLKARQILAALSQGEGFWKFAGKRLSFDRSLIRIPVTYRYRLLCRLRGNDMTPLQVLSHEAYNRVARNRTRL